MTQHFDVLSEDARAFADLVIAVDSLDYEHRALTILLYPQLVEVGLDLGDSVDDVVRVIGAKWSEVLTEARTEIVARMRPPAPTLGSFDGGADAVEAINALKGAFALLREYPLDLAFVPQSEVEPLRPWEVSLSCGGSSRVWPGVSARQAVAAARDFLEGRPRSDL